VRVEQEVDTSRHILPGRARHRVENHRRLLALEAVDCAHPDSYGNTVADASHRHVVRSDDKNVLGLEPARLAVPKEDLLELEEELDAAAENSPLTGLPARTTLVAAHHVLDGLANGNRTERTPGDPAAAESYGGRLFALAPVLQRANTELGASVEDNMNAYVDVDPHGSALKFLVGYGHFCEVMPEVHRDLYSVSGGRDTGFRLEHRSEELGVYEARDTMLWSLGATTAPAPPPMHTMGFDRLARTAPVLDAMHSTQVVSRLVAYYDRALQEAPLVPSAVLQEITGAGRAEFNRVRAACWAFADFAFGIAHATYALHLVGEKTETELWEAHEWLSVCWTYTEFRRWLAEASGLPGGTVSRVLEPFVLDLDRKKTWSSSAFYGMATSRLSRESIEQR